jgi:hypothetical protein
MAQNDGKFERAREDRSWSIGCVGFDDVLTRKLTVASFLLMSGQEEAVLKVDGRLRAYWSLSSENGANFGRPTSTDPLLPVTIVSLRVTQFIARQKPFVTFGSVPAGDDGSSTILSRYLPLNEIAGKCTELCDRQRTRPFDFFQ